MSVHPSKVSRRHAMRAAVASLGAVAWLASPGVTATLASNAGGADKSRPPTFGDCKNVNAGVHNGYDCESEGLPV
jgi:hypothetical protein